MAMEELILFVIKFSSLMLCPWRDKHDRCVDAGYHIVG